MSRSVLILLFLLALWILLGLYLWNQRGTTATAAAGPCEVSWELKDGSSVVAKSDATINFVKSSASVQKLSGEVKTSIDQIAKYLKGNSGKSMTVVGYYDADEKPKSGTLRDLALARANAVKAMLTSGGVSNNQLAVLPMMYDKKNHSNSDCLDGNSLNRGVSFKMGRMKGSE